MDLSPWILGQDAGDFLKDLFAFRFQIRFPGIKHNAIQNVDCEFTLQFGNCDFL